MCTLVRLLRIQSSQIFKHVNNMMLSTTSIIKVKKTIKIDNAQNKVSNSYILK